MRGVISLFLAFFSIVAFAKVEQTTLDNGLKIIVKEDHRAPVVVSMVWYNVGSADEKGGITGVSHVLEHLMFKGTPKYPLGAFSEKIASLGGQENAFTNTDYTAYFEKLAATHLPVSFELEADRMQNLLLDKEEFKKELNVVKEERRMRTDDNPQALTVERFMATAHLASPYHHPIIGWMSDLDQMTINDAKKWYQKYYAPNNATLVVVGDTSLEKVKPLAVKYFGSIKPKQIPQRKEQPEPPFLGKKSVKVHVPAKVPMLIMGFNAPTVKTPMKGEASDPYALEIIAAALDSGESGRLSKELVRGQEIASVADIHYNLYNRYQTQFILFGVPSQGHTIKELRTGLLKQLERLKTQKISVKELNRIKTQIIAQKTFEKDSIFGQAMEIGLLETIGVGWQTASDYVKKITAITPEEIQHAAKQYFAEKKMTEAELIPSAPSSKAPVKPSKEGRAQ